MVSSKGRGLKQETYPSIPLSLPPSISPSFDTCIDGPPYVPQFVMYPQYSSSATSHSRANH